MEATKTKWEKNGQKWIIKVCAAPGISTASIEKKGGRWHFEFAGGSIMIEARTASDAKAEALARVKAYLKYAVMEPWREVMEKHQVGKAQYISSEYAGENIKFTYKQDGREKTAHAPEWHVEQQHRNYDLLPAEQLDEVMKQYFKRWIAQE